VKSTLSSLVVIFLDSDRSQRQTYKSNKKKNETELSAFGISFNAMVISVNHQRLIQVEVQYSY